MRVRDCKPLGPLAIQFPISYPVRFLYYFALKVTKVLIAIVMRAFMDEGGPTLISGDPHDRFLILKYLLFKTFSKYLRKLYLYFFFLEWKIK